MRNVKDNQAMQGDAGWPAVEAAYGSEDYVAIPDVNLELGNFHDS